MNHILIPAGIPSDSIRPSDALVPDFLRQLEHHVLSPVRAAMHVAIFGRRWGWFHENSRNVQYLREEDGWNRREAAGGYRAEYFALSGFRSFTSAQQTAAT